MPTDQTCSKCYETRVPACLADYLIGGFTPNTAYHVIAQDRFGNQYEINKEALSDASGNIAITFPDGTNEVSSPVLQIKVYLDYRVHDKLVTCDPLSFDVCEKTYSCINVSFYKYTTISDSPTAWQLICPCNGTPCYKCGEGLEIVGITSNASGAGWHLAAYGNLIVLLDSDKNVLRTIQCDEVVPVPFYNGSEGPHYWNTTDAAWLAAFLYQPTGSEPGVSLTITAQTFGTPISQDSDFILQISVDQGITIIDHYGPMSYEELFAGPVVPITDQYYRSRIKIITPDGCIYYSAWNTITEG